MKEKRVEIKMSGTTIIYNQGKEGVKDIFTSGNDQSVKVVFKDGHNELFSGYPFCMTWTDKKE